MYKFVLFDMDGTVLDTIADIHKSVNYALHQLGYPEITLKETLHNTGNASRRLMEMSCPPGADIDEALSVYLPYYKEHCADTTKPYDGIIELMTKLKAQGVRMAIVSNKKDEAVKSLSDEWFGETVEVSVGEMPGLNRKPAPDLVFKAIKQMNADLKDCIYVGDTEVDIKTAANAGLPCIAVTWGFREIDEIINLGADYYCDTWQEVYRIIIGQ